MSFSLGNPLVLLSCGSIGQSTELYVPYLDNRCFSTKAERLAIMQQSIVLFQQADDEVHLSSEVKVCMQLYKDEQSDKNLALGQLRQEWLPLLRKHFGAYSNFKEGKTYCSDCIWKEHAKKVHQLLGVHFVSSTKNVLISCHSFGPHKSSKSPLRHSGSRRSMQIDEKSSRGKRQRVFESLATMEDGKIIDLTRLIQLSKTQQGLQDLRGTDSLSKLPFELQEKIMSFGTDQDLQNLTSVNKSWRKFIVRLEFRSMARFSQFLDDFPVTEKDGFGFKMLRSLKLSRESEKEFLSNNIVIKNKLFRLLSEPSLRELEITSTCATVITMIDALGREQKTPGGKTPFPNLKSLKFFYQMSSRLH